MPVQSEHKVRTIPKSFVESAESQSDSNPVQRKIPRWAIVLGVVAFVVFNGLFLIFAMSIGSGTPG